MLLLFHCEAKRCVPSRQTEFGSRKGIQEVPVQQAVSRCTYPAKACLPV